MELIKQSLERLEANKRQKLDQDSDSVSLDAPKRKKEEIELKEWVPKIINLTPDELREIAQELEKQKPPGKKKKDKPQADRHNKMISISPSPQGERDMYEVTPRNVIGIIELSNKILVIRPKITIKNILFLLCYSWEPSEWKATYNMFNESKEDVDALAEAIAKTFVQRVNTTLRRGVLQGYNEVEDSMSTVRGRIRWSEQISRHYGKMPPVEVTYDEFTENVEENRLIKSAVYALLKTRHLLPGTRLSLKSIDGKLDGVQLKSYNKGSLPEIRYTTLNEYYRPAIDIAKFVLRNFSWTLHEGNFESPTFLLYMPKVFEDFVVKALRETSALRQLTPNIKNFPQNRPLKFDTKGSIEIKPDFSYWDQSVCRFVGDCKYKRLTKRKPGESLRSWEDDMNGSTLTPDLYQMLSYTIATDLNSGLLIYVEDRSPMGRTKEPIKYVDLQPRNTKTVLKRRAINLNSTPADILEQLELLGKEIVDSVKEARIKNPPTDVKHS